MKKFWLLPLVLAALVFGCSTATDSGTTPSDTRISLTAGSAVTVGASATSANVTFTGATGLALTASDFTVSTGGAVSAANVSGDTATVTVTFMANTSAQAKTYTVGIAPASTVIKGTATVTVTQVSVTDTRTSLVAGSAVTVGASVTSAEVTFTGATGLTLGTSDFTVSTGGTVSAVDVSGDTVTVTVTFAANDSAQAKPYTVSIASSSTVIMGTATVTITQAAVTETRTALTAGSAVTVGANATSAEVEFTGATGLTLGTSDFTVSTGGTVSTVDVSGDTVTVTVTFAANTSTTEAKTYTVGIASGSTVIMGTATVTVTQAAVTDNRTALAAGSAVTAAANATSAEVEFTGATGLTLGTSDFTVSTGGTVSAVDVSGDTVTVTVTFAANDSAADKTYTVGIASGSTVIMGAATVIVTHYYPVVKDVSGTVSSGGDPLDGATVTISKGDVDIDEKTTDSDGAFTFSNVPAGSGYTVTASKTGYESMSYTEYEVPRVGNPEPLSFNLISNTHVYYDEPFNTDSLANWTIMKQSAADVIEIVVDPEDSENTLLHISKTSSGSNTTQLGIYNATNAGAYGIFTIETRLKRSVSNSSVTGNQLHIYTYDAANTFTNGNGTNSVANFITNLGQMWSHNGSSTAAAFSPPVMYTANTWYKITMRVDTATKKFSIYVDGVLKAENWGFRTTANVNKIDIFNIAAGNSGIAPGEMWVDYIKVYQGEPQFD